MITNRTAVVAGIFPIETSLMDWNTALALESITYLLGLLTNCKQSFVGYLKLINFILHFSTSRVRLLPAAGQEPERLPPHGVRLRPGGRQELHQLHEVQRGLRRREPSINDVHTERGSAQKKTIVPGPK